MPRRQESEHILPVLVERYVQGDDLVANRCFDALQQLDVALDAGNECGVARIGQAKLL
jgi:hypothetical protein